MRTTMFFTPIESRWKELSNGILVDILVHFFGPNYPYSHQDPGIAANNSFWPSPPKKNHIILSLAVQVL